jgi:hypothetical protein
VSEQTLDSIAVRREAIAHRDRYIRELEQRCLAADAANSRLEAENARLLGKLEILRWETDTLRATRSYR